MLQQILIYYFFGAFPGTGEWRKVGNKKSYEINNILKSYREKVGLGINYKLVKFFALNHEFCNDIIIGKENFLVVNSLDKEIRQMFEIIIGKLDGVDKRLDSMEKRLDNVEKSINYIQKRQDEIFLVAKSIEHSNDVRKAELDNLIYKVAHVEGTINGVGEFIESRRAIK